MTENGKPDTPAAQSPEDYKHALDRKRYKVEIITALLLFLYVTIAAFQWREMRKSTENTIATLGEIQKQTTLMRQQLVGTVSAVVVINDFPGIESTQTDNYGFNIGFRNDGHVVASKVDVALLLQREIVDGAKPIGEPWHCEFNLPPILPTKVGEHQCFLKGLDKRSWQPIGKFKQTIAVDGSFSYWNGFEVATNEPICLRYVPSGLKSIFGSEGPGRFVTCDRYPGWIEYLKARMAGNGEIQPPK